MNAQAVFVAVGPTGIGYSCEVDTFPARDQGCVADRVSALLVWDAAAVAYLLGEVLDTHLVTNHLGETSESARLRQHVSASVTLMEPTQPLKGYPFDIVISERRAGSRSWISTGYVPDNEHIVGSLARLYAQLDEAAMLYLYADVPPAYDTLTGIVDAISALERPPAFMLLNVGDIADLVELHPLSVMSTVPAPWVAQASYSAGRRLGRVARAVERLQKRLDPKRANIMLTLGERGVLHARPGRIDVVAATPILPATTVGAGAVFSAAILKAVMRNGGVVDKTVAKQAVDEATGHVAAITAHNDQNRLRIW